MEVLNRSPKWPDFKMEKVPWEGNIEVETRKQMQEKEGKRRKKIRVTSTSLA